MVILLVFYFGLEMMYLSVDFFVAVTIDTFLFIIDFIFNYFHLLNNHFHLKPE